MRYWITALWLAATIFGTQAQAGPSTVSWTLFESRESPAAASPGRAAFQKACAVCHGAVSSPGTLSLAAKYQGVKPALLEERKDLTPPVVLFYIRQGVAMMAQFRKTELNEADAKAIADYLSRKRR